MKIYSFSKGFSLVELMISLVLGLLVIGGAIGVFVANQNTSRFNNTLSEIQQITRHSFQLMSRDIRSAGFSGCGNVSRFMNILNVSGVEPWATWVGGIEGFEAPLAAINAMTPADNTDSIRLMYSAGQSNSVISHLPPQITLNATPVISAGDVVALCDDSLTTVFEVASLAGDVVSHTMPGTINCSDNLGYVSPLACGAIPPRRFSSNAMLMRFESVAWFIAPSQDDENVLSLYRASLSGREQVNEEVLYGISDLAFLYMDGSTRQFRTANAVVNWGDIIAVQVTLTLDDALLGNLVVPENVRNMNFVVTLRNRV